MRIAARHHPDSAAGAAQAFQQGGNKAIVFVLLRAVPDFEHIEEFGHALREGTHPGRVREVMEKVVEREEEIRPAQVGHKFFAIGAQALDFAVLSFTQPINADVDRVVKLGKAGAHLLTHDEIGKLPTSVENFQAAVDRIMIREGDQVHSTALEGVVDIQRLGIAIPAAQEAEVFCPPRVEAVAVQVGFIELVKLSLNHEMLY